LLRRPARYIVGFGSAALFALAFSVQARELTLSIGDLDAGDFSAHSIRARLSGERLETLTVDIDRVAAAGKTWRQVKLSCPETVLTTERISCARGVAELGGKFPIAFSYVIPRRELLVEFKPANDETWRASGHFGKGAPAILDVRIEGGRLERIAQWLPTGAVALKGGRVNGAFAMKGDTVTVGLDVDGISFSDAPGLHAGEKLAARIDVTASGKADSWRWNAVLTWRAGEVFWQPFFAAAKNQRLSMQATTGGGVTRVNGGRLELPAVGTVEFKAEWNHAKGTLAALEAQASKVSVAALYADVLKPLLEGTALSDLRADGRASFSIRMSGLDPSVVDMTLERVSFEDRQRRFAIFGLNGRIPWRRDESSTGELTLEGAELQKLPLGAMRVPLQMKGTRVAINRLRVPVLDGAVVLRDFATIMARDGWRWRFSGEIEPISMMQLSQAVGWPVMHGVMGGTIPELRYRRHALSMDGALALRVFDGTVWVTNLQLIEPFGRAPRLHGDLEMTNLDLELLTRAFDFGTITGRIDAHVKGLQLVGWEPVRFDARLMSSPGNYPRKISQRAVENISSLGGAGAAAAIQRSFLRFFEQFGYDRLGLSCRLENGICEMDGIERAPQGYVIVKGGGIPAISVIGYNRAVDWRELVDRLKRIMQDNVKPIVK
jgi:hypothetical protein